MWKTAFKKFKVIWSALTDHITSDVFEAILLIPWYIVILHVFLLLSLMIMLDCYFTCLFAFVLNDYVRFVCFHSSICLYTVIPLNGDIFSLCHSFWMVFIPVFSIGGLILTNSPVDVLGYSLGARLGILI